MKKIFSISILFSLLTITSCTENFLDTAPKGVQSVGTLSNKAGVNYLLVGAYSLIDGTGTNNTAGFSSWHGSADNWIYGEVSADNAYKGTTSGDQPEISFIEQKNILPDNTHFRGKWSACYDGIARSNDVLLLMEKATDMTATEKAQVAAEVRFLRGHYHFELKKVFNMVPYIDEKTYNPDDFNSTKLPNDKDIWPNIEADLKAAYDVLPVNQAQPGRPTKWAAGAMLAKAYMFQQKFALAMPILQAIVDSKKYSLMPKYHDNFRAVTNNNAESVFSIQFSVNDGAPGNENGNTGATLNYPSFGGVTTCCGFYQPSQNLVNSFKTDADGLPLLKTFNDVDVKNDQGLKVTDAYTPDAGTFDPRLDWTVGRRGITFLDWGVHTGAGYIRDQAYAGPYSPKKHLPYRSDIGINTGPNPRLNANNYRLIRYSHVLLMLAECEIEVGSLEKARELVNQIRRRAANPEGFVMASDGKPAANYVVKEYSAPWTDKVAAREATRFETRIELAMEGHRYFDLVRWGIADVTLNAYYAKEKEKRAYFNGVSFIKGRHEYYPIPLQEILNSKLAGKETLKQNPGY
ncbi:SusD-like, N-terminal [Spirosomataceae bacterium]